MAKKLSAGRATASAISTSSVAGIEVCPDPAPPPRIAFAMLLLVWYVAGSSTPRDGPAGRISRVTREQEEVQELARSGLRQGARLERLRRVARQYRCARWKTSSGPQPPTDPPTASCRFPPRLAFPASGASHIAALRRGRCSPPPRDRHFRRSRPALPPSAARGRPRAFRPPPRAPLSGTRWWLRRPGRPPPRRWRSSPSDDSGTRKLGSPSFRACCPRAWGTRAGTRTRRRTAACAVVTGTPRP